MPSASPTLARTLALAPLGRWLLLLVRVSTVTTIPRTPLAVVGFIAVTVSLEDVSTALALALPSRWLLLLVRVSTVTTIPCTPLAVVGLEIWSGTI